MEQRLELPLDSKVTAGAGNMTAQSSQVFRAALKQLWPGRDDSREEMMLIRESGDAQPVCLRALDDALPKNVRRDVGIPNLVKW